MGCDVAAGHQSGAPDSTVKAPSGTANAFDSNGRPIRRPGRARRGRRAPTTGRSSTSFPLL